MLRKIFSKISGKSAQQRATAALRLAAIGGDIDAVRREIAHRAEIDAKDINGLTPLYLAAAQGHTEVVRLLLDNGAAVDAGIPGERAGTALTVAISFGHTDCAKLLMDRGARHDLTDYDGRTPLHVAVYKGRDALALDILARGVAVNTVNRSGNSPLHEAMNRDQQDLCVALVQAGADWTAKDRYGAPAEDRAIAKNLHQVTAAINEEKERPQREAAAAAAAAQRRAEAYAAALAAADTLQNDTAVLPPLRLRRRNEGPASP
jgi:ankyrin repeat protein